MVRAVGIEPTLLSEPDFESGASTNSATPAAGSAAGLKAKRHAASMRAAPGRNPRNRRGLKLHGAQGGHQDRRFRLDLRALARQLLSPGTAAEARAGLRRRRLQ